MLRHGNVHLEIVHDQPLGQGEGYKSDVEKFPLEHIVRIEKPLPPSPVLSRSGGLPAVGQPGMTWSEGDASSVNCVQESSGEDLPIYVPGSIPPRVRRI